MRWKSPGSAGFKAFNFVTTAPSMAWWGGHGTWDPEPSPPHSCPGLSLPLCKPDHDGVSRFAGHEPWKPTPANFSAGQWLGLDGLEPLAPPQGPSVLPASLPNC